MAGRGSKPGERRGGRKKGTPNKASLATWKRVQQEADPIGFLASVMNGEPFDEITVGEDGQETTQKVFPTLHQRFTAASHLTKFIPAAPRTNPIVIHLPEMKTAEDVTAVMSVVVKEMAAGAITPDEAETIGKVVETQRRALETEDLEKRLTALENAKS
jgi:hypothetical protein